jgi:hypothetical protein
MTSDEVGCSCETGAEILEGITPDAHDQLHERIVEMARQRDELERQIHSVWSKQGTMDHPNCYLRQSVLENKA